MALLLLAQTQKKNYLITRRKSIKKLLFKKKINKSEPENSINRGVDAALKLSQ